MIFSNTLKPKSALQRDPTELCKRRTQGGWNLSAPEDLKHSYECRPQVQQGWPHFLADTHWGMFIFSFVFNYGYCFQILTGLPPKRLFHRDTQHKTSKGSLWSSSRCHGQRDGKGIQTSTHLPKGPCWAPTGWWCTWECHFWFPGLLWHDLLQLPIGSKILQDQIPGRWQA